jgi:PAS domain S-box-containing protein
LAATQTFKRVELPRWSHYVIAVLLCGLVVLVRLAAAPILGDTSPFFLAALAVTLSAYVGGLWPGLLSTIISTVLGYSLFLKNPGVGPLEDPRSRIILGSQIAVNVCISLICGALRSSESETRRSVQQERLTHERLASIFESISDAFITISPEFKLTSFNQAAADLWNLTQESLGKSIEEVIPMEIYEAISGPWKTAVEHRVATNVEVVLPTGDGAYEIRAFPSSEGLLIYFHDISARIKANEALKSMAREQDRVNAFLNSLLAHAPVGFAFFDREYRFERVNAELADMNGMSIEDHIGRSIRELFPSMADSAEEVIGKVFDSGQGVDQLEVAGETPKSPGRMRHWLCSYYPVNGPGGMVTSVGALAIEITERKEIENRLRESEVRFRNLADNAPVMIWVCNVDGTATWFNRPWLDFRNLSLDDAVCEGCFANIHEEDQPWVEEAYRDAFERGESFSLEFRSKGSDGNYRWFYLKGNPVKEFDGHLSSFLMSSIDVTDRITMEESLRLSLANERAARSDAEEANRLKDEFLAGLSHELRTPLTTMLGWSELLMKPQVRETELMEGLQVIQRSSKLQLQLINDLLDMSRISIGKLQLEFEFADLADTVQSIVDMSQGTAREKEVSLILEGVEDSVVVRIDPDRFSQIIWNLLSNAIKFTPSGGTVKVLLSHTSEEATIRVKDSGVGIDPAFVPFVFDRFRQADATRSRRHGGLGLGLAIAKQLTDLHKGKIEARSEGANRGSEFIVTIPVVQAAPQSVHQTIKAPPEPVAADDQRRLVDLCVLLVEDDASSREFLKKLLEIEGATVVATDSAPQARKLFREVSPDILISDIGLPGEDGNQLIRSLRSGSASDTTKVPAIALTAFAGKEDRDRAFESGFNLHLTKPVDAEDLVRGVLEVWTSMH